MTENPAKPPTSAGVKIVRRELADGSVKEYRYDRKVRSPRRRAGALRNIFNGYTESLDFKGLGPEWQARKLVLFNMIEDELGWMTVPDLEDKTARREFFDLRDAHAHLPHRADHMMSALRTALQWAYNRGEIGINHALGMGALVDGTKSPHVEKYYEMDQEEAILAQEPYMRRLFQLALYTGLRRADCSRLVAERHLDRDGWLVTKPRKTLKTTGVTVRIPVFAFPPLAKLFTELPRSGPLLLNRHGEAWEPNEISVNWRKMATRLGFRHMRFHDIRHTISTKLVEAGCTEAERGVILGNPVAAGTGAVYVARTKQLALNSYAKWWAWMQRGPAEVVPFRSSAIDR